MKHLKIPGLLAIAVAALMAFAGTASGTTVTSGGSPRTGNITLTSEGHQTIHNPIASIKCASSATFAIDSHGESFTASGKFSTLTFNSCTNSWHVTAIANGSLEIHAIGGGDGTLTASGAKIDATRLGVTCVYETSNTHIGTLTDSGTIFKEGSFEFFFAATVHISASLPINTSESSGLCGVSNAAWTGSYGVTNIPLSIDP